MDQPDELKLDNQEAMEFHYFKLHDYDNNNKLDGLELGAAMTHYEDPKEGEHGTHGKTHVSPLPFSPLIHHYKTLLCIYALWKYCNETSNICVTFPSNSISQSIELSDTELKSLIDSILGDDDLNNDGYIDYYEFTQAQRRNQGQGDNTV